MAILQIDTYDRAVFESVYPFREVDMSDRTEFATLPYDVALKLKEYVATGKAPAVSQPTDSFVVTEDKVIVTFTWLDQAAAEEYVADKLERMQAQNIIGLISSVVQVTD